MPDKFFHASSLSELRLVHKRDGCPLAREPRDTGVTQVGLLNVAELSVNRLQEFNEIGFAGSLVEFLVACCVDGSVLFRIKLGVELLYILLCQFHALGRRTA